MSNPTTILIPLSEADAANLIAFGNRASMSGAEADTWVDLKNRIVSAVNRGTGNDDAVPGIDGLEDEELKPGGSA